MAGNMLPLLALGGGAVLLMSASKKKKGSSAAKNGAKVLSTEQVWKEGTPGFGPMVTMQIVECPDAQFIGQWTYDNPRKEASGIKIEWTKTSKKATAEEAKQAVLQLIADKAWSGKMPSESAGDDAMPVSMEGTLHGYDYQIIEVLNNDGSVAGYVGAIRRSNASEDWRSVAEAAKAETARLLTLEKIALLTADDEA